jgi:hypothetical protein
MAELESVIPSTPQRLSNGICLLKLELLELIEGCHMTTNLVLDHVADVNGVELHRMAKLYGLPDFVKTADDAETLRPGQLPKSVYADPATNHYPCHTPASTYLSCVFFTEKQANYHPKNRARVQTQLDAFVKHWGIKSAVDEMRVKYEASHKNADDRLPDSDFAFVFVTDDGSKTRHWRMKNAAEVKAAADALFTNKDMPFSDRNVIANKILTKAAQYGASLGEHETFVERQAGRGVCDPEQVCVMLQNRARLVKSAQQRDAMVKLADGIAKNPHSLTPDKLVELAVTIDKLDRMHKLAGHYTEAIPDPVNVIFSSTYGQIKQATDSACALTTGAVYDSSQFSKIALNELRDLFGGEFADEVSTGLELDPIKLAEQVSALPRPEAEMFEQMLDAAGVPPMAHKAASERAGLSPQLLQALSANYVRR